MSDLLAGAKVRHATLGLARVVATQGQLVVIEVDGGQLQRVRAEELALVVDVSTSLAGGYWNAPLPCLLRASALAIRSVNDRWGVFAPSRIQLLPHQLWVCRKVLESWPTRWLVADDVGLGKTVEAGLIMDPLLSTGRVRRLLVIAPSGLVAQWQERMRKMFDIRLARFAPGADTEAGDFWGTHHQVAVSLHTIRNDSHGRWERLLEAEPWDLVVVDEAHHLNADEKGRTLAYELLTQMEEKRRILSMIFFTGTPHRGKTFGFFALMHLLRPDLFDPAQPPESQLPQLRRAMIRNNKAQVTDMSGDCIFTPVTVSRKEYEYNEQEQAFYDRLSEFITTGRAFAGGLSGAGQRRAMLVLITMQKLASSSVAAIRRALTTRLARLRSVARRQERSIREMQELANRAMAMEAEASGDDAESLDAQAVLEELRATLVAVETFNPEEIPAIEELLALADAVTHETKVESLLDLLDGEYQGRSVLLFTEYKATQSLVMSALERRFGDGCTAFINGDGVAEGVVGTSGIPRTVRSDRRATADAFNQGKVRFLVSTEAAGEGIDLQVSCHTLCHVDLPWNPMRLHQRVGRVSRYGQKRPVDVFLFLNPGTVEGQIWQRLFEKLGRITAAFENSMEDPEDMLQAVLGMATPGFFDRVFSEIPQGASGQRLKDWFDTRTATFGGQGAVDYVQQVFGSVARFDFGTGGKELPRVDLPDLVPFFRASLVHLGRRPDLTGNVVSFNTPDAWTQQDPLLAPTARLRFERSNGGEAIAGVGTRLVDAAIRGALDRTEGVTMVPGLARPVAVVTVEEQLTGGGGAVRKIVFGAEQAVDGWSLVTDWELLLRLNDLLGQPFALKARDDSAETVPPASALWAQEAVMWFNERLPTLSLPLQAPRVELAAVLWPVK